MIAMVIVDTDFCEPFRNYFRSSYVLSVVVTSAPHIIVQYCIDIRTNFIRFAHQNELFPLRKSNRNLADSDTKSALYGRPADEQSVSVYLNLFVRVLKYP